MIPVTSDMIPTHYAKAAIRKISKFKLRSTFFFPPNLILKIQVLDMPNSDLKMAVTL
jgi:hypothetical protein